MARFGTPPGYNVVEWFSLLKSRVRDPAVALQLIDSAGRSTSSCDDGIRCVRRKGLINHLRWPDGVADGGGMDWENDMLDFLKRNRRVQPG
jgi:hypothetical protein